MTDNTALMASIQGAINSHLPAELGSALKKRLEQADKDAQSVASLSESLLKAKLEIDQLKLRAKSEEDLAKLSANLESDRDVLREEQRELRHNLEIAQIRQSAAEQGNQALKEVVSLVFCSPTAKRRIQESTNEPIFAPGQSYSSTMKTSSRTVDEDATGPNLQG